MKVEEAEQREQASRIWFDTLVNMQVELEDRATLVWYVEALDKAYKALEAAERALAGFYQQNGYTVSGKAPANPRTATAIVLLFMSKWPSGKEGGTITERQARWLWSIYVKEYRAEHKQAPATRKAIGDLPNGDIWELRLLEDGTGWLTRYPKEGA
jgi:hypothetical protein